MQYPGIEIKVTILLGLDIGSTTIKAVAYAPSTGRVLQTAARPTPTDQPQPGWYQHDPEELWQAAAACLREAAAGKPADGLAISSMAEAGLPLDADMQPLYPIVAWYDTRCEPQVKSWEAVFTPAALHAITGQRINTSFTAFKWLWFKENEPELAARTAHWLSVPDYLLWRLTGEQATDLSLASRTLLFDQRTRQWSADLLERVGLQSQQLPKPLPGGTIAGYLSVQAATDCGLAAGMPCSVGGHDHLCAAFAAGGIEPGRMIDSIGTAEALLQFLGEFQTGADLASREYTCYAHAVPGLYVLKAGNKVAGGAIEWWARQLAGTVDQTGAPPYEQLQLEAAEGVGRRAGPLWLPHWGGYASPDSDRYSRGALAGVQLEHQRGDLFRAQLEGLAFWTRQNREEMERLTGKTTKRFSLLGGAARMHLLAQLKADALNLLVEVPDLPEAAATGAALLAGMGAGIFLSAEQALASLNYGHQPFFPIPERVEWYDRLYRHAYLPLYNALKDIHHSMHELELAAGGPGARFSPPFPCKTCDK